MPAWIHDRAQHIRGKNPNMSVSQSFAIATQMAHKLGKTPKNYGTPEGKAAAKEKYTMPRKSYRKTADRVKKAAALVRLDKRANAMLGAGPGAATPMQVPPPPAITNPASVAQAAPKGTPAMGITPVSSPAAPPAPTVSAGGMPKQGTSTALSHLTWPKHLLQPGRGLDSKSDDFAKSHARAQSIERGGLPGAAAGALAGGVAGFQIAGRTAHDPLAMVPGAVGGAALGALAGGAVGTGAAYPAKLREQMALLEKRRARKAPGIPKQGGGLPEFMAAPLRKRVPEFLAKPARGERLDTESEDFAKNQAFGRALGSGGLIASTGGAIAGGLGGASLGERYLGTVGALGGGVLGGMLGMGAGMGIGTAVKYPSKLKEQMALLEKRRAKKALIKKEAWDSKLLHPRFAGQKATGLLEVVRGAAKKVGFKEAPYAKRFSGTSPVGRVRGPAKKRSREDIFQTLSGHPDPIRA